MKIKVTKKQIVENYKNIIEVDYCGLQWLLVFKNPKFYTCGIYGWNADIYQIDNNTAIVTGYRPFGNIRNWDLTKKYDKKAEKIRNSRELNYKQQVNKLDKLIEKYVEEILQEK